MIQQGQLWQGYGTQDSGFLRSFAGLEVIIDASIGTTYGAGTNQDEIYVLASEDFRSPRSAVRTRRPGRRLSQRSDQVQPVRLLRVPRRSATPVVAA